jgi:hypothetical protein
MRGTRARAKAGASDPRRMGSSECQEKGWLVMSETDYRPGHRPVKAFLGWLDGPLDRGDVWEHVPNRERWREARERADAIITPESISAWAQDTLDDPVARLNAWETLAQLKGIIAALELEMVAHPIVPTISAEAAGKMRGIMARILHSDKDA